MARHEESSKRTDASENMRQAPEFAICKKKEVEHATRGARAGL